MLLPLYKNLMRATTPLLEAYLGRRQRRGKEDAARSGERRGKAGRARDASRPLVWCHAASVGESLSLLAVVERILQDRPHVDVMVTTGTVTSAALMGKRLPPRAFHQYIPVDHPQWVARFLDHWRPDCVIWSESELWPNMLDALRRRGVPAVLLNARMSEKSFRHWRLAPGFARSVLGAFSLCLAQNEAEAARLRQLGAREVRVAANLKYAAKPLPYDPSDLSRLQAACAQRPLVLWASTHAGEEELAARLHLRLRAGCANLLTIIVPRHPARAEGIEQALAAQGLRVSRRSLAGDDIGAADVHIADTMGELGLFFRLCRNVVMGGTFADVGGHNPIEPAQAGCVVFFGPQTYNFLGICADFDARGALVNVRDEAMLEEKLKQALDNPAAFDATAAAALAWTRETAGILDALAQLLAPYLPQPQGEGAGA